MSNQQEGGYKGPDIGSLPFHIAKLVRGMIGQLPAQARVELSRSFIECDDSEPSLPFDLKDYAAIYKSDDRGLVQAVYYDGDYAFNVRITGVLPKGTRERVMGYDQTRLEVLLTPEQSMAQAEHELVRYPWLVEGERNVKWVA